MRARSVVQWIAYVQRLLDDPLGATCILLAVWEEEGRTKPQPKPRIYHPSDGVSDEEWAAGDLPRIIA